MSSAAATSDRVTRSPRMGIAAAAPMNGAVAKMAASLAAPRYRSAYVEDDAQPITDEADEQSGVHGRGTVNVLAAGTRQQHISAPAVSASPARSPQGREQRSDASGCCRLPSRAGGDRERPNDVELGVEVKELKKGQNVVFDALGDDLTALDVRIVPAIAPSGRK